MGEFRKFRNIALEAIYLCNQKLDGYSLVLTEDAPKWITGYTVSVPDLSLTLDTAMTWICDEIRKNGWNKCVELPMTEDLGIQERERVTDKENGFSLRLTVHHDLARFEVGMA